MSTPTATPPSLATEASPPVDSSAIFALAKKHGLSLSGELTLDNAGLDFRVVTARDEAGCLWVLRIPRRADVAVKIPREARALAFLAPRLKIAVPDWRITSDELVAYPRLLDPTALSFDPGTHEVTWRIDRSDPGYTGSLAVVLAELHGIPVEDASAAGLVCSTPEQVRSGHLSSLALVQRELGMAPDLERTLRSWLDEDGSWPGFSTVVHGDLYAGHTLVDANGRVSGIIDWTEVEVSDPSIDFTGHLLAFGEDGLAGLLAGYERAGGRTWPSMARHIRGRGAFAPVRYGLFALASGDAGHLAAARAQLGAA